MFPQTLSTNDSFGSRIVPGIDVEITTKKLRNLMKFEILGRTLSETLVVGVC